MLVNEYFNDFPIDFFKIEPTEFVEVLGGTSTEEAEGLYRRELDKIQKVVIQPDGEGRIYSAVRNHIQLDQVNTTVINASVGQGKTYTVLQIIREYYDDYPNTYIFVAVPFVSLISQYVDELINIGIPQEQIYRYEWLDPSHPNSTIEEQRSRRIHVVTVNCLLGNAGENSVINSQIKRNYLQNFSKYLEGDELIYDNQIIDSSNLSNIETFDKSKLIINKGKNRKKSVFIYDEIHDAIHNFKKDNLFNLWHWQNSIHKNIIISATLNDASLVVIDHLAALTDNKIQIIESERIVVRSKQSDLFLHFNSNYTYKNSDSILSRIVSHSIENDFQIDILCYSKKLAEEIYNANDGAGGLLKDYYGSDQINLCASELVSNQRILRDTGSQRRYDHVKCNIGTNFKTGVNILKDNPSLIIIMPPKSTRLPFENMYGIFSGGINDIIQALARQRYKGEIHIMLPPCGVLDFETLPQMTAEQKDRYIENYQHVSETPENFTSNSFSYRDPFAIGFGFNEEIVKYKLLNEQTNIIKATYEEFIQSILMPIINTSVTSQYNELFPMPALKEFRINKGQKVLLKDKFLAADLSAFITHSAFTNQFINCRLAGYQLARIYFNADGIDGEIDNIFNSLIENGVINGFEPFHERFNKMMSYIYDGKEVFYEGTRINRGYYKVKQNILNVLLNNENPDYFSESLPYKDLLGRNFTHLNYMMFLLQDINYESETGGSRTFPTSVRQLFQLRNKMVETLYPHGNSSYLKPVTENDIFEILGIDVPTLIESLVNDYPTLLHIKTFRDITTKSSVEQKEALYRFISKIVGKFDDSRQYSFLPYKVKKLNSQILPIPYS